MGDTGTVIVADIREPAALVVDQASLMDRVVGIDQSMLRGKKCSFGAVRRP